ncbi:aryl-sulfate sulfotransferase [Desulfovibrio sp. UCD-KL4C]|uniref:aryl-sulfate sulfotransferase n=1 Tax=Desulfovibrio sp. UCD-KL4C TaxID=2578120 RepID=UPI0025B80221|nr:aryl-sulfate sulfotransferase [Desulfovibrio sp. UCD-KL4C]
MSNKVVYTCEDNLITQQNNAEKTFLETFETEKPSLENAHVIVNPYLINPLSALILFKTETEVEAELTVHGKRNSREDITHTFKATTSHSIPVLCLYEGIETKVTVSLSNGESKTFLVQSEELPASVCRCLNVQTSLDYFGNNIMFLTPAGKNLPTGYDYAGEIRWMLTVNTMFDIKRLENGNIMTGSSRFCRMPYNSTGLFELSLLGKIYKEYRMPGNYHHDHWEMEDGNILALTQDFHTDTVEDMIALLDRETGEVLRTWDFKEFLPQDVAGSGSQDAHDWFHNNALWYDKKTNSITLSGRHQDAVVNIDYDTNTLNWIIGDPEGWPQEMVDKYFFKPVGDVENFDWQYEQHACVVCPDGDIMCFDNGQYRAKSKENYIRNRDNFSRGVRYRIDTDKMEIEQIWQYGKERGQDFFSPYICNVEYYDEGHYLTHSGGLGFVDGWASDGLGAFLDTTIPGTERRSITVEEKDGVVLYELEVEGNFYRAEKLTPYHSCENLTFGEGKLVGNLDVTPTFDTIPDVEEVDELPSSEREIVIDEDEDRLVFHGLFEHGSLAMIVLAGEKETRGYFLNTAAVHHLAMCSGAFLEKDDRQLKMNISKNGLSGKYDIKVIYNDKMFQTGITIYC